MTDPRTACRLGVISLAVLVIGSAGARAQQPQAAGPTSASTAPPVISFPAEGITLAQAVGLALQHDPDLQRAEAEDARLQGVLQERRGLFDSTLLSNASFSRRVQELTESRKQEEQKKRDDLQQIIDQGPSTIARAQQVRDLLGQIQASAPGSVPLAQLQPISPTLAATIASLDQLILNASPAQRSGYLSIRQDVLNQAVQGADAQLASARDTVSNAETTLRNIGPAPIDEDFTDIKLDVQVSKLFRNGLSVSPFFDANFNSTGFVGKPHEKAFGGKGLTDLYTFHAGASLFVPLARNRGARAVGAEEHAALLEEQASALVVDHQASVTALNTVHAYWQLRAAQDTAAIAAQSLQFQQQLVQLTQGRSAELPGAEIARARASAARTEAQVQDAQRSLKDARVALATTMGVAATADEATLPLARDTFPAAPDPATLQGPSDSLIDASNGRRHDLAAAGRLDEAGRIRVDAARTNLRSALNLSLSTWYTALDEGDGGRALNRWVGPSGSAALQFEKPLGNNAAKGQLAQRQAEATQRQIDQADLARRIRLNIVQSAATIQESATRVEQTQSAVTLFQSTIDAQFERLRSGDASVIDTVVTQQQQIDARLAEVAAQVDLATRIADLRYRTGTLLNGRQVDAQALVSVPPGVVR